MYMIDSDKEPSNNLSKNLLLLPRILKLIKIMVDDSTPLNISYKYILNEYDQKTTVTTFYYFVHPKSIYSYYSSNQSKCITVLDTLSININPSNASNLTN